MLAADLCRPVVQPSGLCGHMLPWPLRGSILDLACSRSGQVLHVERPVAFMHAINCITVARMQPHAFFWRHLPTLALTRLAGCRHNRRMQLPQRCSHLRRRHNQGQNPWLQRRQNLPRPNSRQLAQGPRMQPGRQLPCWLPCLQGPQGLPPCRVRFGNLQGHQPLFLGSGLRV